MRIVNTIPVQEVTPEPETVLIEQGIPGSRHEDERIRGLALEAISLFREFAHPAFVGMEIAREEFARVYTGEGCNEPDSPVKPIADNASHLVLFAATIGVRICNEISTLFAANEFALGSMLDAAASAGADLTADVVERLYRERLMKADQCPPDNGVLRFSPGYCGWHLGAQRKLFDVLRPGDIGVTLNQSFLMAPLKSVSGVIIAGKKEIFQFDNSFTFCSSCVTRSCRERLAALL